MKFFISHKQEDQLQALLIAKELEHLKIPCYLDILDNATTENGREMTEHIKKKLNDCTDIIVVMSQATRHSQWVPFEVGIAAQRDLPTATYLQAAAELPEFLEYWPRLKQISDLLKYIEAKKQVDLEYSTVFHMDQYSQATSKTDRIYTVLKRKLQ